MSTVDLHSLTLAQLAVVHNHCAEKPVKKFSSKDEAVRRTTAALEALGRVIASYGDDGPVFANAIEDRPDSPVFDPVTESTLARHRAEDRPDEVLPPEGAPGDDLPSVEPAEEAEPLIDLSGHSDEHLWNLAVTLATDLGATEPSGDRAEVEDFLRHAFEVTGLVLRGFEEDGSPIFDSLAEDAAEEAEPAAFVKATKAELDAMSKDERQAYRKARRKAARDRRKPAQAAS